MRKENINFHQTFYPNFDYIGKILNISDGKENLSIDEISMITGIPTGESSGKVLPHIRYCEFMNLITVKSTNSKLLLGRTDMGELIYSEDPYLSERISRLLCHMFLTSLGIGSELWFFICRSMQSSYGNKISKNVIEHDIVSYFKKGTKMSAFNSSYTNENSFGNLNLIIIEENNIRFRDFVYEEEFFYAILYVLYQELMTTDPNRSEFTVIELFHDLKWNCSLNWSENKSMSFLERASEDGWLDLNRQLTPTTILLKRNIADVMELIYSELI